MTDYPARLSSANSPAGAPAVTVKRFDVPVVSGTLWDDLLRRMAAADSASDFDAWLLNFQTNPLLTGTYAKLQYMFSTFQITGLAAKFDFFYGGGPSMLSSLVNWFADTYGGQSFNATWNTTLGFINVEANSAYQIAGFNPNGSGNWKATTSSLHIRMTQAPPTQNRSYVGYQSSGGVVSLTIRSGANVSNGKLGSATNITPAGTILPGGGLGVIQSRRHSGLLTMWENGVSLAAPVTDGLTPSLPLDISTGRGSSLYNSGAHKFIGGATGDLTDAEMLLVSQIMNAG